MAYSDRKAHRFLPFHKRNDDEADGGVVFFQEVAGLGEFLGIAETVAVGVGSGIEGMSGGLLVERHLSGWPEVGDAAGKTETRPYVEGTESLMLSLGEVCCASPNRYHCFTPR